MPVFAYSGRTRQGQSVNGEMEASNAEAVVATLRKQQVITTSVRPKPKDIEISIPGFGGKVSEKDVAIFTRQFSTMIDAGLPLVQCLEILASQQDNKTFQKVLVRIRQDVEGGATLAAALKKEPRPSATSMPTWWKPGRQAAFWIPFSTGWLPISRNRLL
jgi:type IV pilus assembly protein PilC